MTDTTAAQARHAVPVWNQESALYEDFAAGQRIRSIARTISDGDVSTFNALVMDFHPYVADDLWAREHGIFQRRIVPGALVFSVGLGLVAMNNTNTFSYGYDRLRFIKPTFVGDTIYTMRTVLRTEPKYPEMGLLVVSYEVFRADDEQLLLYCEHLQTVRYRRTDRVDRG